MNTQCLNATKIEFIKIDIIITNLGFLTLERYLQDYRAVKALLAANSGDTLYISALHISAKTSINMLQSKQN